MCADHLQAYWLHTDEPVEEGASVVSWPGHIRYRFLRATRAEEGLGPVISARILVRNRHGNELEVEAREVGVGVRSGCLAMSGGKS